MEETKMAHGTMGNQVPFLYTYCMPGPVLHILQTSFDLILTQTLHFTEKEIMALTESNLPKMTQPITSKTKVHPQICLTL